MQNYSPKNLQELQQRCQQMSGQSLCHLAKEANLNIPADLLHAKGWVGQLLEQYLGASSASKAQPDFPHLGVELKTVPINKLGKPLESTYVCTVQTNSHSLQWRDSWVYNKLKHVLWVPIISSPELAITDRIISRPFFWQMDAESEEILRIDWEELMEMLQLGYGKHLGANYGTYLHIRPKAANSRVLVDYTDADGHATKIVPKGFYLRTTFTSQLLKIQTWRITRSTRGLSR